MNKSTLLSTLLFVAVLAAGQVQSATVESHSSGEASLDSKTQKLSYALGMNIAENVSRNGISLDTDSFLAGIRDVMEGKTPKMDQAEMRKVITGAQQEIQAARQATKEASRFHFLWMLSSPDGLRHFS